MKDTEYDLNKYKDMDAIIYYQKDGGIPIKF